ncbi:unnamed protein product, partial [Vitis vinifera]
MPPTFTWLKQKSHCGEDPQILHGHARPHQAFAKPTTLHTHHTHHHSCSPLPYLSYRLNPFLSLPSTTHSTTITHTFHTH